MRDIIERIREEIQNIGGVGYALNGIANDLEKRVNKLEKYLAPLVRRAEEREREQQEELEEIKAELGDDFDEDYDYLGYAENGFGGECGYQIEAGAARGREDAAMEIKALLEGE